mmetsp:Transcript_74068/g.130938  ORF Transcript_74068/g.130938 Transcript_74068/m.130938 type:complete len:200 (-) Transcript_74068:12-611(-)
MKSSRSIGKSVCASDEVGEMTPGRHGLLELLVVQGRWESARDWARSMRIAAALVLLAVICSSLFFSIIFRAAARSLWLMALPLVLSKSLDDVVLGRVPSICMSRAMAMPGLTTSSSINSCASTSARAFANFACCIWRRLSSLPPRSAAPWVLWPCCLAGWLVGRRTMCDLCPTTLLAVFPRSLKHNSLSTCPTYFTLDP